MSNKSPAFLFYPSDFEQGTQLMSSKELGVYMRLLIGQFNYGEIPKNDKKKTQIARITARELREVWPNICDKFTETETGFYNERLRFEIKKRTRFTKSRSDNASKRYLKEDNTEKIGASGGASAPASAEHMQVLMEKEKENRVILFRDRVLKINDEFKILTTAEVDGKEGTSFVEYWTESGDKDRKLRCEKEKSFNIKLRMKKWRSNDYNNAGKNDVTGPVKVG